MADLYPTFAVPAILEEQQKNEAVYPRSAYFDFEKGDFALDGGGKLRMADGFDAWKQWCIKTIATQRRAFYHYTDGLGIEGEQAMAQPTEALQRLSLETTITEALMADPYGRTMEVRDFKWERGADSLHMSCTVVGQDDRTAALDLNITEGGAAVWWRP